MVKRKAAPPWFAYVGVALTSATIGWAAVTQWFDLKQRVHDLERAQQFMHGNVSSYLPKEQP